MPALVLDKIAEQWDGFPEVRARVRDEGKVLHHDTVQGDCIKNCVLNLDLLTPLVSLMSMSAKRTVPGIDSLKQAVHDLLVLSKREPEQGLVVDSAWRLRKMCVFIKMKVRKRQPSFDLCLHYVFSVKCFSG